MKKILNKMKQFDFKKCKKYRSIFFIVLILSLLGIAGTIAFQAIQAEFGNEFKTSSYNVIIEEEFQSKWGTKKVSFVNRDGASVAIRINYIEMWEDPDGIILNNKINKTDVVTKTWTEAWQNDFTKGNDGWYYYNKLLTPEGRVQVLSEINLNEELIKDTYDYSKYLTSNYELDFIFEAVQADSNAIKELWGHDVTVSNNEINWNFN